MERMRELATSAKIAAHEGYFERDFLEMIRQGSSEDQQRFALEKFREYRDKGVAISNGMALPQPRIPMAKGHVRVGPYIRAGILPIEFVLSNAGKSLVETPLGVKISFTSWRIGCYAAKGVKCVRCGREGAYFAAEKGWRDATTKFHLNLYHVDADGEETMMTVDHIYPKSLGGGNELANLQPMCGPCNFKKGSKVENGGRAA